MPQIPTQASSGYQGPSVTPAVNPGWSRRPIPKGTDDWWRSVPQVQHSTIGTGGGGGTLGIGFQATDPNVDYEMVGGLPSFQARYFYDQNRSRPPFRAGEVAWYPLRVPKGIRVDRYLGHAVYSPVIPRRIPGQWQTTVQVGFGNQTSEYIGLRAPRISEGAGMHAVGSAAANPGWG